jgi:uncharacterized protein (TIGR03067 family)
MKIWTRLVLLIGLPLLAGCQRDDLKTDEAKTQGPWTVMSMDIDGKADYSFGTGTVTFTDDVLDFKTKARDTKTQFRLDATQDPKEIDFTNRAGSTSYGIYSLEGDTLKICIAPAGGERPAEFTSKPRSKRSLIVLKRDKMNIATFREQYRVKHKTAKDTQSEQ